MNVDKKVSCLEKKLEKVAASAIAQNNYERAMAALNVWARLLNGYEQKLVEDRLENLMVRLADTLVVPACTVNERDDKTVLLYDGHGNDQRGLALIYLRALGSLGYHVIYLTVERARNNQPIMCEACKNFDVIWDYLPQESYGSKVRKIISVFNKYKPATVFIHASLSDVAGGIAFCGLKGKTNRFWINLTDHAFWIGKNSFDYCVEFRNIGGCISVAKRGIPEQKLRLLPYYPYIDENVQFKGLPFDIEGKKLILSGGMLEKTLGDPGFTFYTIVDKLLCENEDLIFLYMGRGNTIKLEELKEKHDGRVFWSDERADFFQCIKRCTLYLGTYPIAGGLMMQYAAVAGKIPLQLLKEGELPEEVLIDEENRGCLYKSKEELISDANRLLADDNYRIEREERLKGAVITENEFAKQVNNLIIQHITDYPVRLSDVNINNIQSAYKNIFDYKKVWHGALFQPIHKCVWRYFPGVCFQRMIDEVYSKLLGFIRK